MSHRTAPVEMREAFALGEELTRKLLAEIHAEGVLEEALILDTCNRIELHCVVRGETDVQGYFFDHIGRLKGNSADVDASTVYRYDGLDAVRHLFRVSASLDSQIVGEHQILGQVKNAYRLATHERTAGYLLNKILQIPGASAPYAAGKRRIEQVRYSWEGLTEETGVHSEELGQRAADFGVHYWTSHHPFIVPEPCTIEPTESYTKDELDEFAAILAQLAEEARSSPELVKSAPHNSTIHTLDHEPLDDPAQWAVTWRAYLRKAGESSQ